jgi:hypothetical protein
MKRPPPVIEPRGRAELRQELLARAQAWIPEWQPSDPAADPGIALLAIAARIESEVTKRLAQIPQKCYLGLLDWLGVHGLPGRAARVPVAFRMNPGASALDVGTIVQMRASPSDTSITLEVRDMPSLRASNIVTMIGADETGDRWFRAPPGILSLDPRPAVPNRWRPLSAVIDESEQLQLDPPQGLAPLDVIVDAQGREYEVTLVKDGLVSVDPPISAGGLSVDAVLTREVVFRPFSDGAIERQKHEMYFGGESLLDVKSAAIFEVSGSGGALPYAVWSYWGLEDKVSAPGVSAVPAWLPMQSATSGGRLFLLKHKGELAELECFGHSARWIRATLAPDAAARRQSVDKMTLAILYAGASLLHIEDKDLQVFGHEFTNAVHEARRNQTTQTSNDADSDTIDLAGIGGTAPLVMTRAFYPLGVEPRLFDAFYLGSKEAFSKAEASVTCQFQMGDQLDAPAVAFDDKSMVALAADGKLHIMRNLDPITVDATTPRYIATQPKGDDGRPITLDQLKRPGALRLSSAYYASASRGGAIWLYRNNSDRLTADGAWQSLQALPESADQQQQSDATPALTVLVKTDSGDGLRVYALRHGALYYRAVAENAAWHTPEPALPPLAMIVPIQMASGIAGPAEERNLLLCVTQQGEVHVGSAIDPWRKVTDVMLDGVTYPLAFTSDDRKTIRCVAKTRKQEHEKDRLVAFSFGVSAAEEAVAAPRPESIEAELCGDAFALLPRKSQLPGVIFLERKDEAVRPVVWYPFDLPTAERIPTYPPIGVSEMTCAPVMLTPTDIAFPINSANVEIAKIGTEPAVKEGLVSLRVALRIDEDLPAVDVASFRVGLFRRSKSVPSIFSVDAILTPGDERTSLLLLSEKANAWANAVTADLFTYSTSPRQGTTIPARQDAFEMEPGDATQPGENWFVRLWKADDSEWFSAVTGRSDAGGSAIIMLARSYPNLPGPAGGEAVSYEFFIRELADDNAVLLPAIQRPDLPDGIGEITSGTSFTLYDKNGSQLAPTNQRAFDLGTNAWAVLTQPLATAPAGNKIKKIEVLKIFRQWIALSEQRDIDPKLSWEYWNGSSWSVLKLRSDTTDDLLSAGELTFSVPADIAPTQVLGQQNYWIRARLVGGDYGRIQYVAGGKDGKTVVPDASNLHPPYVTRLRLKYTTGFVVPDFLVTLDGGVPRDQSEANRTPNAIVEYAIPLADQLAHLNANDDPQATAKPSHAGACVAMPEPDGAQSTTNAGIAIYLGFDQELSGEGIAILFDVVDGDFGDAGPLQVHVLVDGQFQLVPNHDATLGLAETGIIRLALSQSPQRVTLFGDSPLHWLRFSPNPLADPAAWRPRIKGVYLNAAEAIAAETIENERLGSSNGSPDQTVMLAKTPVLDKTLSLRVREPLDDDDAQQLRAAGTSVADGLGSLPGFWVQWTEVDDLLGCDAQQRAFTLDDDLGVVRFGNGIHGRIPPPGSDSIYAVMYQHGGGAAANQIAAWSDISLVTPLAGVQAVTTLDDAAGGADPEDADAALAFASTNLAMRGRAVTLGDFEQLSLQFAPAIGQVRARAGTKGIELLVAMRGATPVPSRATLRELRDALLAQAPPGLAQKDALVVRGPNLVDARLTLTLMIDSIENGAAVAQHVADAIATLLDPATGGIGGGGWRFGALPSDTDIAAALDRIGHLIGLTSPEFWTRVEPGMPSTRITAIGRNDLLRVAPEAILIKLQPATEKPS